MKRFVLGAAIFLIFASEAGAQQFPVLDDPAQELIDIASSKVSRKHADQSALFIDRLTSADTGNPFVKAIRLGPHDRAAACHSFLIPGPGPRVVGACIPRW